MREIFDLQWKLNIATMKRIDLDFEEEMGNPERKLVWIENYRKALCAELAELIRDVRDHGMETQNGKIELVDMLHFLVSLSQIVALDPEDVPAFGGRASGTPPAPTLESCALRTFLALDDLQNSLKWKWWARGGGFKEEKAIEAVRELWRSLDACCGFYGLDFKTMKEIYIAKNRINFQRQEQDYNEDTKTEDDNRSINV